MDNEFLHLDTEKIFESDYKTLTLVVSGRVHRVCSNSEVTS